MTTLDLVAGYLILGITVILILTLLTKLINKKSISLEEKRMPLFMAGAILVYVVLLAIRYTTDISNTDRLQILLQLGLVVITAVYAWLARQQAESNKIMANSMKKQADDTAKLVEATKIQAEASMKLVEATKLQSDTTTKLSEATKVQAEASLEMAKSTKEQADASVKMAEETRSQRLATKPFVIPDINLGFTDVFPSEHSQGLDNGYIPISITNVGSEAAIELEMSVKTPLDDDYEYIGSLPLLTHNTQYKTSYRHTELFGAFKETGKPTPTPSGSYAIKVSFKASTFHPELPPSEVILPFELSKAWSIWLVNRHNLIKNLSEY